MIKHKLRSSRNNTLVIKTSEVKHLKEKLLTSDKIHKNNFINHTILGDCFEVLSLIPNKCVDLLILDPPYNLTKKFGNKKFLKQPVDVYTDWLIMLLRKLKPLLKTTSTVYICGDWRSSISIFKAASLFFNVRNRITWEREKGRGALSNWKNTSEDIWFCTMSNNYTFNVEDIKLRRQVLAPYRTNGKPKDWQETNLGNFRNTYPSNLWTDITIPFWSMPENTEHPTQKSEKLLAKLILASSNPKDLVFDPFLGSGTSSVVAKKLDRKFCGIELEEKYALLAEKRLYSDNADIQGYTNGVFWERNTHVKVGGNSD